MDVVRLEPRDPGNELHGLLEYVHTPCLSRRGSFPLVRDEGPQHLNGQREHMLDLLVQYIDAFHRRLRVDFVRLDVQQVNQVSLVRLCLQSDRDLRRFHGPRCSRGYAHVAALQCLLLGDSDLDRATFLMSLLSGIIPLRLLISADGDLWALHLLASDGRPLFLPDVRAQFGSGLLDSVTDHLGHVPR